MNVVLKYLSGLRSLEKRAMLVPESPPLAFVEGGLANLRISVEVTGSPLTPDRSRGLLVLANHPTGALDGLACLSILLRDLPDTKIFAGPMASAIPQLSSIAIPMPSSLEGVSRVRPLLRGARHLRAGGTLLMFPAGRVSQTTRGGQAIDLPWPSQVGKLVHATQANVGLVAIGTQNSRVFYLMSRIHPSLLRLQLARELLNKQGTTINLTTEAVVRPNEIFSRDSANLTDTLRRRLEALL